MKELNESFNFPREKKEKASSANHCSVTGTKKKAKHRKAHHLSLINKNSEVNLKIETNGTQTELDESINSKTTSRRTASPSINDSEESNEETQNHNSNPKMNAFQVLMESRHKVIGTNSSGKELTIDADNSDDDKEKNEKLAARKKVFSKWAEKKGGLKRKREEEREKDEIIKRKMNRRTKRLKKLLEVHRNDEHLESDNDCTAIKKRRRIKKLSCSSDSNISVQTFPECKENNSQVETDLSFEEFFCKEDIKKLKSRKSKSSLRSSLEKNNSGTFEDSNEKLLASNDKVLLLDGNVKALTKKSGEFKNGLLSFLQVDKAKTNIANESELENSRDTFTKELESHKINNLLSKSKISKSKMKKKKNNYCEGGEEDLRVLQKLEPKAKSKKHKKKEIAVDESSQESCGPKLKSWRMKIRVNMEQQTINKKSIDGEAEELTADTTKDMNSVDAQSPISVSSVSENEERQIKKPTKSIKIAPVFEKATPKPKIDPEVLQARRQFLLSGTPSSLKKFKEKQQSLEEREVDAFPLISHVQQKSENPFWKLPYPKLELTDFIPLKVNKSSLICEELTNSKIQSKVNIKSEVDKVDKLKVLLHKIKQNNPNYPVYKSFKSIYAKSGKNTLNSKPSLEVMPSKRKRGKPKQVKVANIEIIEAQKTERDLTEFTIWTEKYRPRCSEDILGNMEAVKNLKKWLVTWKNFSQEINSRKKRRNSSSSEFDFESTDCDSNSSTRLPGNTVILGGPCGSGKTTATYAVCEELHFDVIEVNASSKRTGKKLMQQLQEATQSHQVRKNDAVSLTNLFESNKSLNQKSENKDKTSNMCVLLVEDIDLVFEQDDGFIFALSQIISTSKRPIILTTTDYTSVFVQKFLTEYEYIPFFPLSSSSLATWLQILCLIEGKFVDKDNIAILLDFNKGDIRKTLLELQFWVLSGGQLLRNDMSIKLEHQQESAEEKYADVEDVGHLKEEEQDNNDTFTHKDCLRSFQLFENYKPFHVPYYLDLGLLWWNIPIIFEMPDFTKERMNKIRRQEKIVNEQNSPRKKKLLVVDKMKLDLISKFYDSLVFADISFRKVNYYDGLEPSVKNYFNGLTDTLELDEKKCELAFDQEFIYEITHLVIDTSIKEYCNLENTQIKLDIGVPGKLEKRWRAQHHVCEDIFKEGLPTSLHLDRKSFALDYLPEFRTISRSEIQRAANNTKRGNRFRSYFKELGINCNDSTSKIASNMLQDYN